MFPVLFFGNLTFMFLRLPGVETERLYLWIIIGIVLMFFSNMNSIERSFWNILLNPFRVPDNFHPMIWKGFLSKSYISFLLQSDLMMIGLLNLQKREKICIV